MGTELNPFEAFTQLFRAPGRPYICATIDPAAIEGGALSPGPVRAQEQYFRLVLAEMFLRDGRNWFTNFFPAVYSAISVRFGDQEEALSHIAGPTALTKLPNSGTNKAVLLNYPLTALLPFNGGSLELELGLVAVPGSNDALRLLNVLSDFSKSLAVPQVSLALSIAHPLLNGITELVGANQEHLVLRMHNTFAQGGVPLKPGYTLIVAAPVGRIDVSELYVRDGRIRLHGSGAPDDVLLGYDYILLRVDVVDERNDYHALTSIDAPFRLAMGSLAEAARAFDRKKVEEKIREAESHLVDAKLAAMNAKELTNRTGRRQVITALQQSFEEARALLGSGLADEGRFSVDLTGAMQNAMSVAEARQAGPVLMTELLQVVASS